MVRGRNRTPRMTTGWSAVAVLCAVSLVGVGCGSRRSHESLVAEAQRVYGQKAATLGATTEPSGGATAPDDTTSPIDTGAVGTADSGALAAPGTRPRPRPSVRGGVRRGPDPPPAPAPVRWEGRRVGDEHHDGQRFRRRYGDALRYPGRLPARASGRPAPPARLRPRRAGHQDCIGRGAVRCHRRLHPPGPAGRAGLGHLRQRQRRAELPQAVLHGGRRRRRSRPQPVADPAARRAGRGHRLCAQQRADRRTGVD